MNRNSAYKFSLSALESRCDRVLGHSRPTMPTYTFRGSESKLPSASATVGNAFLKPAPVYSGDKMIGIATLHKSNAVPVFSEQDALDISKMRR